MSDLLRKHKRGILVGVIALVAIPFVIWGGGFGRLGSDRDQVRAYPDVIAQVGSIPISSQNFLLFFRSELQRRSTDTVTAEAEDLVADGTVQRIVDRLVDDALMQLDSKDRNLNPSREYLTEKLQEEPRFQNDQGQFDRELWNQWVKLNENTNWNYWYDDITRHVNRKIYGETVLASARILDEDVRRAFEEKNTKIRVKHAPIELNVERTEEQIATFFEENPERYQAPEERTAEFIALSLRPPEPPIVAELVERARAGEDFSELAREHSEGPGARNGGSMNWILETLTLPDHQKVLFDMEVGAVSDPVRGPLGYHIYKVEEERPSISDNAGERDVRASQIEIRPKLDEAEREALMEKAIAIAESVKETGDLQAAAGQEDLEVKTTSPFSITSQSIDGVTPIDSFIFRRALSELELGAVSDVVEGRDNLFVAKIVDYAEPHQKAFEDVREDVERDAISMHKQTPDYRTEVQRYVTEIQAKAKNFEDVKTLFPELELEVELTDLFTAADFLPGQGVFWRCQDVFDALGQEEPGAFVGPIDDLRRIPYFVELVERNLPDESLWEGQFTPEEETLRRSAILARERELQQDFLLYLRDQANAKHLISQDTVALADVLGLGRDDHDEHSGETTASSEEASSEGAASEGASSEEAAPSSPDPGAVAATEGSGSE